MKLFNQALAVASMLLLAGCATPSTVAVRSPVGPSPEIEARPSNFGFLQVYSAQPLADKNLHMREFFWDDYLASNHYARTPAHTAYSIYTQDGRLVRRIQNAQSRDDAQPTRVPLRPGRYRIEAQAKGYNPQLFAVRVPVLIRPGQTTVVHLEGHWHPTTPYTESQIVRLPDGDIAGWQAGRSS